MPRCDSSQYALYFPKCGDILDELGHDPGDGSLSADEMTATIDLLLDRGIGFRTIRADENPTAVGSRGFKAVGVLANTGEVADRLGVKPEVIVRCIDAGLLTGAKTPNDFYRLVVIDSKLLNLKAQDALSAKKPVPRKLKGKGLKDVIAGIVSSGVLPSGGFGVDQVRSALIKVGWLERRNYAKSSLPSAMKDLEYEGKVVLLERSEGDVSGRRWGVGGVTAEQVSSSVAVSDVGVGVGMEEMIEELSDVVAARVKKRAMEKLGL